MIDASPCSEEPTSKNQKAASLWTLGRHKPVIPVVTFPSPPLLDVCSGGSLGRCFQYLPFTRQAKASFYPYALRVVSIPSELTFGRLRYCLAVVPPQPNSPSSLLSTSITDVSGLTHFPTSLRQTNRDLYLTRVKLNRVFFPRCMSQARSLGCWFAKQ